METYTPTEASPEEVPHLNLITHVHVEPAHHSDANALIPAIEATEAKGLKPKEVLADTLYGSDDNQQKAESLGVELVAPTMGAVKEDRLGLSDFQIDEKGVVLACPQGHAPAVVKKRKRISIGFDAQVCEACPLRSQCPVKKGNKHCYLRVTDKEIRIARRRKYERSSEFRDRYRWRAGVEATMSEYDRRTGGKHLRVRGLKAVKYCATLKALAVNIFRAAAFRMARMAPEQALGTV